jgi:hypothetical protein
MSRLKKITLVSMSLIGLCQIKSIYNYGKFYNKVMQLRFNGGVKNVNELYELNKLINK